MESNVNPSNEAQVELDSLVDIFFEDHSQLGGFDEVPATAVPEPQRSLLNHDMHMTVTLEKFHSGSVDVEVLQARRSQSVYSREIMLRRQSDGRVVQYGIVRLHFEHFTEQVRSEIENRELPLGRILINHDVMRQVRLLSLYRVHSGDALAKALGISSGEPCFGRTALIYCNGQPAIELLEIVTV